MAIAHPTRNTDKDLPCVRCGNESTSIIREGADPRLKCNACNFMFNGSESTAAKEAGAIPNGPPKQTSPTTEIQDAGPAANPREPVRSKEEVQRESEALTEVPLEEPKGLARSQRIPRTPGFVFISKDRKSVEFTTEKDLVKTALRWESSEKNYDIFQLTPKQSSVKVNIE